MSDDRQASVDFRERWEGYASIWKCTSGEERRQRCAAHLDPGCVYTDPLTQRTGWDQLIAYMEEFHQQVPGGHFVTTHFQAHHDRSIAQWNMVSGGGDVIGTGISYATFGDDGKLRSMNGFFATD